MTGFKLNWHYEHHNDAEDGTLPRCLRCIRPDFTRIVDHQCYYREQYWAIWSELHSEIWFSLPRHCPGFRPSREYLLWRKDLKVNLLSLTEWYPGEFDILIDLPNGEVIAL